MTKEEFNLVFENSVACAELNTLGTINLILRHLLEKTVPADPEGKTVRYLDAREVLTVFSMSLEKIIEEREAKLGIGKAKKEEK